MAFAVEDLRHLLRRAVCAVLGGFFVIWVGQFLFDSEYASRATARLVAPLLALGYGQGSADKIGVVLVDEPSLAQSKATWPPKYGYHADQLEAIATYRPKAIFVDMLFVDRRADASIKRLAQTLCDIRSQGIPVFLARDMAPGSIGIREELQGDCAIPVAVDYEADDIDHLARDYALVHAEPDGESVVSPALGLYQGLDRPGLESAAAPELAPTPMSVVWGVASASTADENRIVNRAGEPVCDPYERGKRSELFRLLLPSSNPACAFHATVRAYELRAPDEGQSRELAGKLEGRVVFYGASLASTGDFLSSPLHGRIPGVYFHAMAYDNLLTYGASWKRAVKFKFDPEHWRYLLWIAALIAVSASIFSFGYHALAARIEHAAARVGAGRTLVRRGRELLVVFGWRLLLFARAIVVACVLTIIGHWWLDLGVFSYIEVVAAALALELFEIGESVEKVLFGMPVVQEMQ
ncbi:MAG TPA: CHASE2 domain-containing protein [Aromatoleum sp.]|uniref:CHASE2 domain-containing protein n=1 Tax=Aromatoleum sp. TaxID=2307007 RepID=UPI002B45D125|nr:CHASE2 domain-containing protein [Aromatoleum sp.]HJV28009.1 CHASE2 domain-containing protein [Aromatoleum sp.]